ncbi:MAG: cobaltochelatase subunit CobN [Paracoccaceae bacterium]|nr:cobaltochelatase subunit CobN [Paracoccaceae bacterium]
MPGRAGPRKLSEPVRANCKRRWPRYARVGDEDHPVLKENGYEIPDEPEDAAALMKTLLQGPTNVLDKGSGNRDACIRLSLDDYLRAYRGLPWETPDRVESRRGEAAGDPFLEDDGFPLPVHRYGKLAPGIQPARGYNIDPNETYHSPDLPPPHNYLAFYIWLWEEFGCHVIIHLGKHGNLKWLPGKAIALSECCFLEAVFGAIPQVHPFAAEPELSP